jgi:hypothetical protein
MALKTAKHHTVTTPIETIAAFETQEAERITQEIHALHEKENEAKHTYALQMKEAEEKAKKQANQDLQSFKDEQPSKILEDAKRDAAAKEAHIMQVGRKKSPEIVRNLIQSLSQYV